MFIQNNESMRINWRVQINFIFLHFNGLPYTDWWCHLISKLHTNIIKKMGKNAYNCNDCWLYFISYLFTVEVENCCFYSLLNTYINNMFNVDHTGGLPPKVCVSVRVLFLVVVVVARDENLKLNHKLDLPESKWSMICYRVCDVITALSIFCVVKIKCQINISNWMFWVSTISL